MTGLLDTSSTSVQIISMQVLKAGVHIYYVILLYKAPVIGIAAMIMATACMGPNEDEQI